MDRIEIYINDLVNEIDVIVDVKEKKLFMGKSFINIEMEDIDKLIRIIRNWDKLYVSEKVIGGGRFLIKIVGNNYEDIIEGRGKYPNDFQSLLWWIGEFNGRINN